MTWGYEETSTHKKRKDEQRSLVGMEDESKVWAAESTNARPMPHTPILLSVYDIFPATSFAEERTCRGRISSVESWRL